MQRDIRPDRLIALAEQLCGRGAGPGQPRNTDLRRGMSTAYYALFHRLALATARNALAGASADEIFGVARHITHSSIKEVCTYVTGSKPPKHLESVARRMRLNIDLSVTATAFVGLQEAREDADYNHLADFSRPRALGHVATAVEALTLLGTHEQTHDFQALFGLVALKTSLGRR